MLDEENINFFSRFVAISQKPDSTDVDQDLIFVTFPIFIKLHIDTVLRVPRITSNDVISRLA